MTTKYSVLRRTLVVAVATAMFVTPPFVIAQNTNVLKLGGLLTVTGPNASLGKEGLGGLEYAAKMVNAAGGVKIGADTYMVQLINIDDESKAERTVAAVEKLIGSEKTPVIFTTPASTTTLAILPVLEKSKTIGMGFIAAAPAVISPEYSYSFRSTLSSITNVNPGVDYMIKTRGIKNIAFVGRNDDWGRSAAAAISARAKSLGATIVMEEYFDPGTTDFSSLFSKIRSTNADAVIAAVSLESVAFAKQYRELRVKPTLMSVGVNLAAPLVIKAIGPSADGMLIATGPTTTETPAVKAFVQQFEKANGRPPLPYEMVGYDNMMIVLEAMKKAGSTDSTKVAESLRKLEYKGLLQDYRFAGTNQSDVVINVNEIKDGRAVPIGSLVAR
jgi:branched-chain amino acid transport system substrate-binding protein